MFFKRKKLTCSICNKDLTENEELVAFIKMPKIKDTPYGIFPICLAHCAQNVYCKSCYSKSDY